MQLKKAILSNTHFQQLVFERCIEATGQAADRLPAAIKAWYPAAAPLTFP
jgi:hypothetical protein